MKQQHWSASDTTKVNMKTYILSEKYKIQQIQLGKHHLFHLLEEGIKLRQINFLVKKK